MTLERRSVPQRRTYSLAAFVAVGELPGSHALGYILWGVKQFHAESWRPSLVLNNVERKIGTDTRAGCKPSAEKGGRARSDEDGARSKWHIVVAMKFHTEYLKFHTRKHREYVHITPQVEAAVKKSGIKEGMVLVSAMHITAGVYVNDNESGLIEDIDHWLEGLAPFRDDYRHHDTGETNGDSHLKALLIHHQVIVPVTDGRLDFGPWQRIFYAEFDGQRDKRLIIKIMGE
jgi:secondary thiamine-phosphate synthase enzyme